MITVLLLVLSCTFMNLAWYGHLRWFEHWPMLGAILVSWCIALPEYMLQVPANRVGHGTFTGPQLKVMAEAISIAMFLPISAYILRETPSWRELMGLGLVLCGVGLAMSGRTNHVAKNEPPIVQSQ